MKNSFFNLYLEITKQSLTFYVLQSENLENFKILHKSNIKISESEDYKFFDIDRITEIVKKNIYHIEQEINYTFKDVILIFSVGGGTIKNNVSVNLINAIKLAKKVKADIFSIVGKMDGYAYEQSNVSVCVPFIRKDLITPYSEAFQAVIWHCLVSDPRLQKNKTKW